MNILHLLSQNQLTGAEVYAVQLVHDQLGAKHQVFQISNQFFVETEAQKFDLEVETKSIVQFLKNVRWLRDFIIRNRIHVIHTHSRAAAKMAFWSRIGLKVGMVSTVHGRQHPSFSKKLMNQYGDFIVAVCESVQQQLQHDFKYSPRRMLVLRNPISASQFGFIDKKLQTSHLKIGVIGRTSGPKGLRSEQILNALPDVLQKLNCQAELILIGGDKNDLHLKESVQVTSQQNHHLTNADYAQFDLVIGSGRVAMEALSTGVPTIAFGEAKYIGLTRFSNLKESYVTNFGDMDVQLSSPTLPLEKLEDDLKTLLSGELAGPELKQISEQLQKNFDSEKINRRLFRLYESSYFLRNYSKWIPILMYHKIPLTEIQSEHKIFVTANRFRQHLQFFKNRGLSTLTFNDLKKFKSGQISFDHFPKKPLILTFDDGYRDNLENASPLLKEFGFKAQLFLLADGTISSNAWDQSDSEPTHEIISGAERQKWLGSAFEIGSHGMNHKKITKMTEQEARNELRSSKQALEAEFKQEIPVFAFTYGDTHFKAANWAFEEGYHYAVNTDTGGLLLEEDPFRIFRVSIFPDESWLSLYKKTSTWYRRYFYRKRKH